MSRIAVTAALAVIIAAPGARAADHEEKKWDVASPPGEATTVEIDTTSGTWMSLDVSPDGRTIAFDLLGDIYTLPISGGDATPVASGMAWTMQPRFSPDGAEIAYTSDAGGGDNIWVMKADGSDRRQLTTEGFRLLNNPAWSPDGRFIAARKHFTTRRSLGTGEIWLYHTAGGDGVVTVERPNEQHQKEIGEPVFSPDGRYIYYSLDSTPGPIFEYAQDSNGQIFQINRYDLRTGEIEPVVTGAGGAVRPQPSPDGKHLAFVRRIRAKSALFVKDLTSGEVRPVYADLDQDLQEVWAVHGAYPNFDWMPDSKSLVIWAGGGLQRIDVETGDARSIPFRVRDTRKVYAVPRPAVTVAPDTFATRMVRHADVSPDGTRAVFESAGRLYVKRLPDGEPERLTSDGGDHFEFYPSWSRDGRSVVFVAWRDDTLGQIRTVRAGGGRSRVVTEQPGHYREPAFSPDGRTIVFRADSGGYLTSPEWSEVTGVLRVPAAGGTATLVADDGRNPHFGRDSARVFVTRSADGTQQLASMDLDGNDVRVHATGEYVRTFRVAPDERHFAFRENYHVYALPMPPGGKPVAVSPDAKALPLVRATGDGGNFPRWSGGGDTLHWSLGPTLFSAGTSALFADGGAEDGGYSAPEAGASMSVTLTSDRPDARVAFTGAKIITMTDGAGGIIEDGVIVTSGNRIEAVGARGDVSIPDGAEVIDVAGRTIIPGLIDAHAHGSQGDGIIPQQNWINFATLALGVTTMHDPSNDATEIFAAAEMQRAGRILAPRLFSTGNIVYGARSASFADVDDIDDAREHVRRLKAQGAMSIKNYNQPRREQRQQVTVAAREEGLLVVAEGGSLYHMDLSMVADGNSTIEHNLPQSVLYDDVLQFWSQTGVAYTPTLVVTYGGPPAERYWYAKTEVWKHPLLSRYVPPHVLQPRAVRRELAPDEDYYHVTSASTAGDLAERGVLVSIGAHGQREGLASHWEIWGFAQGGMSAIEALATATVAPARALGFERDLGTLEAGKLADLVVIDADVAADIYQTDKVTHVMLNGRLYDAATLREQATGTFEPRPFYWQD